MIRGIKPYNSPGPPDKTKITKDKLLTQTKIPNNLSLYRVCQAKSLIFL